MKALSALLLLLPALAVAQAEHVRDNTSLAAEAQVEVPLTGNDYLLLSLSGRRQTDFTSPNRRLGFDQGLVVLGYEHFWNEHWSWGATATYGQAVTSFYSGSSIVTPGLLLRHRSALGPLTFGQRLAVEYALNPPTVPGRGEYPNRTLVRLRLDFEKLFPLNVSAPDGLALRPRLSFEPLAFLRFQKEEDEPTMRTIDFTALRAEVGVRLSPQLDITPWYALFTRYYYLEPQYDSVTGEQVSGGKYNKLMPGVGLEVRYSLSGSSSGSERRQLPTQH